MQTARGKVRAHHPRPEPRTNPGSSPGFPGPRIPRPPDFCHALSHLSLLSQIVTGIRILPELHVSGAQKVHGPMSLRSDPIRTSSRRSRSSCPGTAPLANPRPTRGRSKGRSSSGNRLTPTRFMSCRLAGAIRASRAVRRLADLHGAAAAGSSAGTRHFFKRSGSGEADRESYAGRFASPVTRYAQSQDAASTGFDARVVVGSPRAMESAFMDRFWRSRLATKHW
jgi:hypothetical protein